jgi:hypothetical protein
MREERSRGISLFDAETNEQALIPVSNESEGE